MVPGRLQSGGLKEAGDEVLAVRVKVERLVGLARHQRVFAAAGRR